MRPALAALLAVTALASLPARLPAGPVETAIVAAMKLPAAPNYAWTSRIADDARSYEIHGQTDQSDFSRVTMPMVSAVRRSVTRSSSNSDNEVEAIFLGAERCVVATPHGWKRPDELTPLPPPPPTGIYPPTSARRPRPNASSTPPAYSNLQLNLSRPHEDIGVIVGSYTEIHTDGDVIAGTLSETGAKLLLVHPGQHQLTPLSASGTFRLWVQDGALVRYEVSLHGTLAVETPNARREVVVNEKSVTEIKAIGTTKFEIPDEARRKLGR